jgi:hypothetical protein
MALYSLIQFTTTILAYYCYTIPSNMMYLYSDGIISTSLFITMSMTEAENKLSK